jgi:uncharacterized protein (TIGR02594 family)
MADTARLLPVDAPQDLTAIFSREMPWMNVARSLLSEGGPVGTSTPTRAVRLVREIDRMIGPIDMPWCGFFVAQCLRAVHLDHDIPRIYFRARPWRSWGREVSPQLGAIMCFWHYDPRTPFGHVAFYLGEDEEAYHVLGGNQDEAVSVKRYPKERFVTARWPRALKAPGRTRWAPPEEAEPFRK